jgi:hypothetical protein
VTVRRIISVVLTGSIFLGITFPSGSLPTLAQTAANANDQALDKLLGPIALYPDPLLAQVLACASSPDQVKEVSAWLKMQDKALQGSKLQEAAVAKGFDASFAAIVLFPDVLDTLVQNIQWTTELGKAFVSDQKAVLASVQRLRKQAQTVGNLKTTPQQEVKVETQEGQQVIVIQPANPQIVYVPVYNTQVVYTTPPPPEKDDSDVAAAAILGFMAGIAIGVAASDPYPYGWGAWGVGWHSSTVIVTGGAWRIPPGGRYGYARPVPYGGYRAPTNINAPTRNVNVNVDRSTNINNINTGNINNGNINTGSRNNSATTRPTTQPATRPSTQPSTPRAERPSTQPSTQPAARPSTQPSTNRSTASATPSTRGFGGASAGTSASATQARQGTSSSALSGYSNKRSTGAASSRGQRSAGGGRRR